MGVMKGHIILSVILVMVVFSCATGPAPEPSTAAPAIETPPVEESFDSGNISEELYNTTKAEVQTLIDNLNGIIRNKDYEAWVDYLDTAYFAGITSPEYLREVSNSAALKSQKIILKTPRDYFTHVVVPSRSNSRVNDRVDDIEFITYDRVKAYTVTEKGQRVRLYDLGKTGSGWKILN
jgi:hypothetical protein